MNKHELQSRTKDFALRILKLIDALPRAEQLAISSCEVRLRLEQIIAQPVEPDRV